MQTNELSQIILVFLFRAKLASSAVRINVRRGPPGSPVYPENGQTLKIFGKNGKSNIKQPLMEKKDSNGVKIELRKIIKLIFCTKMLFLVEFREVCEICPEFF